MSNLRPKPTWQVETVDYELFEKLDDAFRQVMDPELGLNIMELGLIRDVRLEAESAHVKMIMTTPFCPYAPALFCLWKAPDQKLKPLSMYQLL